MPVDPMMSTHKVTVLPYMGPHKEPESLVKHYLHDQPHDNKEFVVRKRIVPDGISGGYMSGHYRDEPEITSFDTWHEAHAYCTRMHDAMGWEGWEPFFFVTMSVCDETKLVESELEAHKFLHENWRSAQWSEAWDNREARIIETLQRIGQDASNLSMDDINAVHRDLQRIHREQVVKAKDDERRAAHRRKRVDQLVRAKLNREARNAPVAKWERYGVPLPTPPIFETTRVGMEWVYVFSVEDSIELAQLKNQSPRMKIGRTTHKPSDRIRGQINSATPGAPVPVMYIRCADAQHLESHLHACFKRSAALGGGTEWFYVTPREIVAAVRNLHPETTQIQ